MSSLLENRSFDLEDCDIYQDPSKRDPAKAPYCFDNIESSEHQLKRATSQQKNASRDTSPSKDKELNVMMGGTGTQCASASRTTKMSCSELTSLSQVVRRVSVILTLLLAQVITWLRATLESQSEVGTRYSDLLKAHVQGRL